MEKKSRYEMLRDNAEKLKQKRSEIASLVAKIDDNFALIGMAIEVWQTENFHDDNQPGIHLEYFLGYCPIENRNWNLAVKTVSRDAITNEPMECKTEALRSVENAEILIKASANIGKLLVLVGGVIEKQKDILYSPSGLFESLEDLASKDHGRF